MTDPSKIFKFYFSSIRIKLYIPEFFFEKLLFFKESFLS